MNFLDLNAFWFALALPVIVIFYLLKRKRVVQLVSSTLLWQRFLAEQQANAPFQKLRKNWLLYLQLLLVALIVFALARPYFQGEVAEGRLRVIVLDASASMKSTDVAPSRFAEAQRRAIEAVDALTDNDQMVVLVAGGSTEVRQSETGAKARLRDVIRETRPTDSTTRLDDALRLADTLTENRADAEIHLYSDGAVPFPEGFTSERKLVYHQIGESDFNVGITAMDVRANPENPLQRAVFANVLNASTNAIEGEVELRFNDSVLSLRALRLEPKENHPLVFTADQQENGFFTLRLLFDDRLDSDNEASVISILPEPVRVLLAGDGNRFLEKALGSLPNTELATTRDRDLADVDADIVVLDNITPITWPAANLLAINTQQTNWFPTLDFVEGPPIVDWKNTHPLLRFVSFDNVAIARAQVVPPPNWGLALVDSPSTPLIVAGEIGRHRVVWTGFDTLESTWPLRVSFPIFVANAVDWLNPSGARSELLSVQAGSPFRFQFDQLDSTARVTRPDGTGLDLTVNTNRAEVVFGDTSDRGIYRLQLGTNEVAFAVNLLDPLETDIRPRPELPFGNNGSTVAATERPASLEFWRWIALAGLGLLMFEWWFYHQRTA